MKIFPKLVLALGAVAAVIALAYCLLNRRGAGSCPGGPDLAALQKTDPALRIEAVLRVVKPQMTNLTALAVGRGDIICVGSMSGIAILDSNGVQVISFAVGRPVGCLAVTPDDEILAGVEDHIEVYAGNGERKAVWRSPAGRAKLTSLAISSNFVFVADCNNRIVWRFDRSGGLSGRIGDKDNDRRKAGFVVPSASFDLAVAPNGSLWVANPGEHRLEHFTADGGFLSAWGRAGLAAGEFCGCCNPSHFALKPDGMFVTSEKHIVRVKLCDGEGEFRGVLCGQEEWGREAVGLDLAVDSRGRILVLDPAADAVRIYTPGGRSND